MHRSKFGQLAFATLLFTGIQMAQADGRFHPPFEITGSVMKNHDRDTIKLVTDERGVITIRLSGADTPETGHAYWKAARNHLRSMVAGEKTTAWCYKQDRFYREVCHVRVGNQDIPRKRPSSAFKMASPEIAITANTYLAAGYMKAKN